MNTLLIMFTLIISSRVLAFDLKGFFGSKTYEVGSPSLKKYVNFLKKDGRCSMAIVTMSRPHTKMIVSGVLSNIRCIGPVVFSKGTIKEKKGCAAFFLEAETGKTKAFTTIGYSSPGIRIDDYRQEYNLVEKKSCKEAFPDLLRQRAIPGGTVENALIRSASFPNILTEPILLYSEEDLFTDWYFKNKQNYEKEAQVNYLKEKQEGFRGYDPKPVQPISGEAEKK